MSDIITVKGADELQRKFRDMGAKGAAKYAVAALRTGAKVLLRGARQNAPAKSGLLRRSIAIKVGKQTKDQVTVKVGPRRRLFKKNNAFYAAFVEFGHFLGKRIRKKFWGKYNADSYRTASVAAGRGFVKGDPYMEKTYDQKHAEAERVASETMLQLIVKDVQS